MPVDVPRRLPFAVDTWTPASSLKRHRFLTHAHRDHLTGIAAAAPAPASIYATRLTVVITLHYFPQLDPAAFVEIEAGAPPLRVPDNDGDFTVTAFDANHCPGAVMFLFEGAFGTFLHTGDCRLTPDFLHALPLLTAPSRCIDYLYLDCTFARCPLQFPTKEDSIRQVLNCIWRHPNAPAVYLVCDMLGQEDVLIAVSRTFGSKIHVDRDETPECHHRLSLLAPEILADADDAAASRFRVAAFPRLTERATEILALARARREPEPLVIRPSSQWYAFYEAPEAALHRRPVLTEPMRDEFGVWHVCLSMHSSRDELEQALGLIQPRWVVSTTPPCMAIDLGYVKKHCTLSRLSPDDCKLLGITDAMSTTVTAGSPLQPSVVTLEEAIEKNETCSAEEFGSIDSSSQVEVEEPTLEGFEIRVEPPVTLFGITRFGLLQNESQLWKDEYRSVEEVIDAVETDEAMDSAATEPELSSKHGIGVSDKSAEEVIQIAEMATTKQNSAPTELELQKHGKSNGEVEAIDSTKDERMLQSFSRLSDLCTNKDNKYAEMVRGNRDAELKAQQHDFTVHTEVRTICRSRVTEQGKNRTRVVEEISDVHVTVSAKNTKEEAEDGTTPSEIGKKSDRDSAEGASETSTVVGSSKALNADLRRLYRSMNVPVPRPLPSLVELMAASKRPRVSQTVQL